MLFVVIRLSARKSWMLLTAAAEYNATEFIHANNSSDNIPVSDSHSHTCECVSTLMSRVVL